MMEKPTLLVLHGGPGFDHASMRPYFDRFADTHQVIYLDHRGNGRSGGEPADWTLAQWGDDIADFCEALGIEKPVVYGLSFGGMVAMSLRGAASGGPREAGVLLDRRADGSGGDLRGDGAPGRAGGAAQVAEAFWSGPTPELAAKYIDVCMPLYNPVQPDPDGDRKRGILRTEVMFHFIEGEQRTMDLLTGLAAVRCPTLVLAGGLDPITPLGCSEAIHAALPAGVSELVVFEEAGHGVHRDEPERAEAVLRRFLG